MNRLAIALIAGILIFLSLGTCGYFGLLAGSMIGEKYLGSAEPMIEMLYGGVLGIVVGSSIGAVLAFWCFKKLKNKS